MKTLSPVRFGRRMMAVAVCGAALSTASMLAQDNQSAPMPPSQHDGMGGGGPRGGGHMEERHLEMMTKRLNLTPDQVTQIKGIEDESRTQAKAVHEDTSIAPADKRPKMMALRESAETKVRAVLNEDQKVKFDAMQAKMKERMQNHRGGPEGPDGPPPPPAQ